MNCPKCKASEVDSSGTCPACGFHADGIEVSAKQSEKEYSGAGRPVSGDQETLPQWRVELSRRLMEIKGKRVGTASPAPDDGTPPLPFPTSDGDPKKPHLQETQPPIPKPSRRGAVASNVRKSAEKPRPKTVEEHEKIPAAVETRVAEESKGAGDLAREPASLRAPASSGDVRHLIDDVVVMRGSKVAPVPAQVTANPDEEPDSETKLVLLSRTLSGMIDLLAVFICAIAFVAAEDIFSGLEMFDETSFVNAGLVFIAMYFVYSLFFLGAANQTIGMMITHLRLVADDGTRPAIGNIVSRCVMYVFSVVLLGIGLLWGCFDREAKCLHDRLSGTRIESLPPTL